MAAVIARLEAEIVALDQAIEDAIGQNEDLRARHDLLISVPGIATHTAAVILCELPGGAAHGAGSGGLCRSQSEPSAVRLVARCAVADLPDRQRHPARGPLLPGSRCDPLEPAGGRLRQRLKDQGRLKPKQIVGAAMRKLLHLCFGVLKTGKPFDPNHASATDKTAATT